MSTIDIKLRVQNEMNLLSGEVLETFREVRDDETSKRFAYVDAQLECAKHILEATMARDEGWKWFPPYLDLRRKQALSEYQKAKQEKNHDARIVVLGRLRFMSTLARRIADPRRPMLFRSESPWSATSQEEDLWERELNLLLGEAIANYKRVEPLGNESRRSMALAPIYLANELGKRFLQVGDCSDFKDTVYDYIDSETERYSTARAAGDRQSAQVMLARVRFAKKLARRLENPQHQNRLAWVENISPTRH